MGFEPRIKHRLDAGAALEMPGDGERVRGLALIAQMQGAHAAQQQPGLERARHAAHARARRPDLLPALVGCPRRQHARQQVAVPGEIFRGGVEDDVGAEFQRPKRHRRRRGGVHAENRAGVPRNPGGGAHVDHVPGRVHAGLDPDDRGPAGPDRRFQRAGLGRIEEADLDPAPFAEAAQQVRRAVIHHPRRNRMVARAQAVEEGRDRRHARREDQRVLRAFQFRQHLLDMRDGRVGVAAVGVAAGLVAVVAREGRGGMDRRHDGAGFPVEEPSSLGEQGVERTLVAGHALPGSFWRAQTSCGGVSAGERARSA